MSEPTILFVKPGAISAADKTALHDAGVVVVEIENPQDVKLARAGFELPASGMLAAALAAMSEPSAYEDNSKLCVRFVGKLSKLMPEPPCS